MKRSIVQHGNSSLTVTLPFAWVQQYGLKKGNEVNLEIEGTRLVISTEHDTSVDKKVVSTTDYGLFTKNNLSHLYQNGYDELEIQFADADELSAIKDHIQECIGYEIIDQRKNVVFIQSIAHTLESDFDVLLRKAFLITKEMGESVRDAISKKDFGSLQQIRNLESINNRLTLCCLRIVMKRGYRQANRVPQIYSIIKELERIADEYRKICDLGASVRKEKLEFFGSVIAYFETFYKMFYKFEPGFKKIIYIDGKALTGKGESLLKEAKGEESVFLHHALNIIMLTSQAAGAYFSLML